MELVLPRNYIEIEQEEMMYLDGGDSTNFARNVYGALKKLGISYSRSLSAGLPSLSAMIGMTYFYAQVAFPSMASKIGSITLNPWMIAGIAVIAGVAFWAMWEKRIFY